MTDSEFKRLQDKVRVAGETAGRAAASWAFDGNTTYEHYAAVLKGLEDGDPEIIDTLPFGDLSGEWADMPTGRTILEDFGIDPESDEAEDILDAYMDSFDSAVLAEVERIARYHLSA